MTTEDREGFDPGDYHLLDQDHQCMSDLWRGVVQQAIRDMAVGKSSSRQQRAEIELEAIMWLGTPDFHECCALAFIEPQVLEDEVREILKLRQPYRTRALRDLADRLRDPPPRPRAHELELDHGLASEPDFFPVD